VSTTSITSPNDSGLYHITGCWQFGANCLTAFGQDEGFPFSVVGMQKCGGSNQIWTYDNSTGNICTYQGGCLAAWRPDASCLASWRSDCRPQVAMIYAGKENPMSWPRLSFDFATSEIATSSTQKTAGSNLAGAFSLRGNCGAMLFDPTHLDEPAAVGVADNTAPQNNCTSNPGFKPGIEQCFTLQLVQ